MAISGVLCGQLVPNSKKVWTKRRTERGLVGETAERLSSIFQLLECFEKTVRPCENCLLGRKLKFSFLHGLCLEYVR